tara:strand:+ start:375 stop:668 length:294 start_codon:yes stop_codon:yes gene_type:complete
MSIHKYNGLVNDEGYYTGPEMEWNVEDVEIIAGRKGLTFQQDDYARILVASLTDNPGVMQRIEQAIADTIEYMMYEKILTPKGRTSSEDEDPLDSWT